MNGEECAVVVPLDLGTGPARARVSVLWYVHHHGAGHWRRALAVTRRMSGPVVFASSSEPGEHLGPGRRLLRLPMDAPSRLTETDRTSAFGTFHWVPEHHEGLAARHAHLLAAVTEVRPSLAVVDVSVEIAVLLRTAGVPVVSVRLPGTRDDAPHRLGFAVADQVVMPVPEGWGMHTGSERTTAVGLVSGGAQADTEPGTEPGTGAGSYAPSGRDVVVVLGHGGSRIDLAVCRQLAVECPDRPVRVLGVVAAGASSGVAAEPANLELLGRRSDPFPVLASAAVVVANCGLGTVADTVRARRPLVALPEPRPFGEQHATAAALESHAVVLPGPPEPGRWEQVLQRAERRGPPDLAADGASRFAALVEALAARRSRSGAGRAA